MGVRFRKSINLGGGLKINLSKSGIGYSWGVKGYRITKTAKGNIRKTVSIPGTGISFVDEVGHVKNKNFKSPTETSNANICATQEIVNGIASEMISDGLEDMLGTASGLIKLNRAINIGIVVTLILGISFPVLILFPIALLVLKWVVKSKCVIDLSYNIDSEYSVDHRVELMLNIARCKSIWRIMQTNTVNNRKYSSGAGHTVNRVQCNASRKAPFPFRTNMQVASFKSGAETLVFMPDILLIIQGSKIGALNYSDVNSSVKATRFIEDKAVPQDTQVVGKTWERINKSGEPDKRFKNNRQLPICLYGEIKLSSPSGLNTVFMYSNPNA